MLNIIAGLVFAILVGGMVTGVEDAVIGGFDKFFEEWDCHKKAVNAEWAALCKNTINYYKSTMSALTILPTISALGTFAIIIQKLS